MRIPCPFCGLRDDTEFSYESDAAVEYPDIGASEEAWHDAVFLRENPRGKVSELWRHHLGCRAWIVVERDVATHEIFASRLAHPGMAKALGGEA